MHAIYSDVAGQPNALALAREFLDPIKASAAEEALTDFDPSGSSGGPVGQQNRSGAENDSVTDSWATQTISTDTSTSLGTFPGSGSDDRNGRRYIQDTESADAATKELLLAETFPKLRRELVAYTLKKCNNDFNKAIDELLNQTYFEDSKASSADEAPVAKGIDAFSEDYHIPQRGNKGKGKKKQRQNGSVYRTDTGSSESDPSPTPNRWSNTSQDVEFITSRTNIPAKAVSSLYHENGASLSATILSLVRKDIEAHKKDREHDPALVQDAIALNEDFPTIDLEYALAVIRLTTPSTSKGHELAKALTQESRLETTNTGGIKLDLRYAPVDLSDPENRPVQLPALAPSATPRDANSIARARGEAFQQASAAYRKGKSTPLMKQAAAYYAQEGRNLSANLKAMSAFEADVFVSSQSGTSYLDLHGVTVADATRIAKQRTLLWWNSLGERRIPEWSGAGRRGGGENYRIITGLGRHSEGGRGKLGPAVTKALMQEGWKVEIDSGEILVTGLARRR